MSETRWMWGAGPDGRPRLPCPERPEALAGQPLGMYHCPVCGLLQMAGAPHLPPEDYEAETGREWPAGYGDKLDPHTEAIIQRSMDAVESVYGTFVVNGGLTAGPANEYITAAYLYMVEPHMPERRFGENDPRRGCPDAWPWDANEWKPTPDDRRAELLQASALLLAAAELVGPTDSPAGEEQP